MDTDEILENSIADISGTANFFRLSLFSTGRLRRDDYSQISRRGERRNIRIMYFCVIEMTAFSFLKATISIVFPRLRFRAFFLNFTTRHDSRKAGAYPTYRPSDTANVRLAGSQRRNTTVKQGQKEFPPPRSFSSVLSCSIKLKKTPDEE